MDVSIVIVSYNVKKFIPFCLERLFCLDTQLNYEVIIVDNDSIDGSSEFIRQEYPRVRLIKNSSNKGFSYGCNKGAAAANGKYLLFLNPDTIVAPNLINLFYDLANSKGYNNAFGAEMFDGSHVYLNESSRSFPTIKSALFRLFKLDSTFNSKQYHNNRKEGVEKVEVLTGAVLFISRAFFDELNGFSTDYFMYGEDIDLSYRIHEAGGSCWVNSEAKVIHFKGESSRRSFTYYKNFYHALAIYANKFILKSRLFQNVLSLIMIGLGMFLFVISRIYPILKDITLTLVSFLLIAFLWSYSYHADFNYFDWNLVVMLSLFYGLVIAFCNWSFGNYLIEQSSAGERRVSQMIFIIIGVLAISSLFSEGYRFSRSVLVFGIFSYFIFDLALKKYFLPEPLLFSIEDHQKLQQYGFATIDKTIDFNIDKVNAKVIDLRSVFPLSRLSSTPLSIFYYNERFNALYNSRSGKVLGRYIDQSTIFNLSDIRKLHQKRIVDLMVYLLLLPLFIFSPFLSSGRAIRENMRALKDGVVTTVGYNCIKSQNLPPLKNSLIPYNNLEKSDLITPKELDYNYAMHYSIWMDLSSIGINFVQLLRSFQSIRSVK